MPVKNNKVNSPLISVIIPVFNGSLYLKEAVLSVINSNYKNIEILLIDDGSKDDSIKICHQLEKKYQQVKFFSFKKNVGLGRVLNFALKKARGQYICRLNQDDLIRPDRIAKQINFLLKNPQVVAVGSNIRQFTNQGHIMIINFLEKDKDIKKTWHLVSPFSDPSVIYRKNIALKIGGYDQSFWPADDTQLWLKMGKVGQLANIQKILVDVRFHSQAASVKYFRQLALSTYKMHRWAHYNINKANFLIQGYWIIQLLAGLLLPPNINWAFYRFIKKLINKLSRKNVFQQIVLSRQKFIFQKKDEIKRTSVYVYSDGI